MLNQALYKSISIWAILLVGVFWTVKNFEIAKWNSDGVITVSDTKSYYSYLPAIFIYQDPTFKYTDQLPQPIRTKIFYHEVEGVRFPKNMMGTSVMLSPFFFMAHIHSGLAGTPQDGYAKTYEIYLTLASIFWSLIGLIFLRKVLLRFFAEGIVALTLLTIALGTNLYFYTTEENLMSHPFSFSLGAILLFALLKWNDRPSFKMASLMGVSMGLILLIRPTGATVMIIPLFLLVRKMQEYLKENKEVLILYKQAFVAMTIAGLVLIPQLLFWKMGTGNWVVDSYIGERFVFESPYVLEGMFSYRKGWLLYTPVMFFAIGGFWAFAKMDQLLNKAIAVYLTLTIYLVFSWWCWWYGGSFGMRAMIDSYPFLSLPLAASFAFLWNKKWMVKTAFALVLFFLIFLNQFQIYQLRHLYLLICRHDQRILLGHFPIYRAA